MTTIIINEKTKKGKIILDLIREMGVGKIIGDEESENRVLNSTTIQAIREAETGKAIKCKNFEDYLEKVSD